MSADLLREAAERMRELADGATPGRWHPFGTSVGHEVGGCNCAGGGLYPHEQYCGIDGPIINGGENDIPHIAAWHPNVARAVADWLDAVAAGWAWDDDEVTDLDGNPLTLAESVDSHAVAVARAFLGRQS